MRNCSHFEHLFDGYLEGTQSPVVRARVERHLSECERCREFLAELRVIDGLLVTTSSLEPAPNFTFAVMAEVRSLHAPKRAPSRTWAWIVVYLIAAWAVFGAWYVSARASALETAGAFGALWHYASFAMQGLVTASHVAAHQPAAVIWLVGVLLVLDVTAALAAVTLYITVRPRLLRHLSRLETA